MPLSAAIGFKASAPSLALLYINLVMAVLSGEHRSIMAYLIIFRNNLAESAALALPVSNMAAKPHKPASALNNMQEMRYIRNGRRAMGDTSQKAFTAA